jgi:sugar transferase (PEP-CTERM/EpsH1 system associated)
MSEEGSSEYPGQRALGARCDACSPLRQRILFLTPQMPYPPEQGAAIRNYNLIVQVAAQHEVALLTFAQGADQEPGPLAGLCRPLVRVPMPPERSARERLRTLFTTDEPDMAVRLYSPAYAQTLRELLMSESFDIVQVEGLELACYLPLVRRWLGERAPKLILDEYNAEYLLQRRAFEADLRSPRRLPTAFYSLIQWRRLARFEREVCRQADTVLAVSEADAEALRRLVEGLQPVVVPNGVDTERYHPGLPDSLPLEHPALLFTGKMDFRPNSDAVLWFHRHVWPLVRARAPQAHLYIVGKNPPARFKPLWDDPGVTVSGYVPDILPYFGSADVYIVPLRIGGGTRLKVLEAMAAGLPLVSTTLGVEGIALSPGQHALLADTPQDFAEAILSLLADPERRRTLGAAARQFVLEHYDWRLIAPRLAAVYATSAKRS